MRSEKENAKDDIEQCSNELELLSVTIITFTFNYTQEISTYFDNVYTISLEYGH